MFDIFSDPDAFVGIVGTNLLIFVVYWSFSLLFMVFDVTGKPAWIQKYKTQPGKNSPVDPERLREAIKTVLWNQTIISIPFSLFLFEAQKRRGISMAMVMPNPYYVVQHLIVFILIEEIGFYYSHRLLHTSYLYKTIHKKHHEWTAPIGVVAVYAHPVEYLIGNLIPLMVGPLLMGSDIITFWIWMTLSAMSTINHHSGYHLPLLPSSEFHDYHHLRFNQNYGLLGIMDWFHGTDAVFRQSKQFRRHRIILSEAAMIAS